MRSPTPILPILIAASICLGSCWNKNDVGFEQDSLEWRLHDEIESLVYVTWSQTSAGVVHVEYELDGEWHSTPSFDVESGTYERLVVGIPYDTSVNWRMGQSGGGYQDGQTITTGGVPSDLPIADLVVSNEDQWFQNGNYLLTSINQEDGGWFAGTYWTFIVDRQGRPIWAQEAPLNNWTLYAQIAISGNHILWDENTRWSDFDNGAGSKIHATYLDEEITTIATPGLHHAFVQLPDGTLSWGSKYHGEWESIVEKPPGSDNESIIWVGDSNWPEGTSDGFIESNCLYYVESNNSYLYSFYTNHSIIELDRESGETLWWAGAVPGGYSFDPESSQVFWQHGLTYTDSGTLLLSTENEGSTKVHEYNVDHENETLTLVWSYDSGIYADTNGDARRLPNGNTLHMVGAAGHIVEVDPDGEVVWRLEFPGEKLLGRGEFIEDLYDLVAPN